MASGQARLPVSDSDPSENPTNGVNYDTTPYVPGLSQYQDNDGTYESNQVLKSSGADCSGFLQMSLSYEDSSYAVVKLSSAASDRDQWTGGRNYLNLVGTTGLVQDSTLMGANGPTSLSTFAALLVPGDILVSGPDHVAIVAWIKDLDEN